MIRSVRGCKRWKEIEAAHGMRERLQGMELQSLLIGTYRGSGNVGTGVREGGRKKRDLKDTGKGCEDVVASHCCASFHTGASW